MALGRRGSITDLPYIIAGIFSIAIFAFFVTLVLSSLNDKVQENNIFNTNAKDASQKMSDDFPAVMDGGIVFIFFAMVLVSLILASLIPVHPIFIPFYILEWLLLIWLGAGIANTYQAVTEVSFLANTAADFTLSIFFFQYFPYAIGFAGALLAIVMYKVKGNIIG